MRRLLVPILLLLAACGTEAVVVLPESDLPEDVYGSPPATPQEPIPEEGTVYLIRDHRLLPVTEPLPQVSSFPEALISALLTATPPPDARTAIPPATRLIGVDVDSGVATVDLSGEFEQSAPGRGLALRVAQIVYTITENPEVLAVRFAIEGEPAAVLTGNERVVDRPVSRADYESLRPPSGE